MRRQPQAGIDHRAEPRQVAGSWNYFLAKQKDDGILDLLRWPLPIILSLWRNRSALTRSLKRPRFGVRLFLEKETGDEAISVHGRTDHRHSEGASASSRSQTSLRAAAEDAAAIAEPKPLRRRALQLCRKSVSSDRGGDPRYTRGSIPAKAPACRRWYPFCVMVQSTARRRAPSPRSFSQPSLRFVSAIEASHPCQTESRWRTGRTGDRDRPPSFRNLAPVISDMSVLLCRLLQIHRGISMPSSAVTSTGPRHLTISANSQRRRAPQPAQTHSPICNQSAGKCRYRRSRAGPAVPHSRPDPWPVVGGHPTLPRYARSDQRANRIVSVKSWVPGVIPFGAGGMLTP